MYEEEKEEMKYILIKRVEYDDLWWILSNYKWDNISVSGMCIACGSGILCPKNVINHVHSIYTGKVPTLDETVTYEYNSVEDLVSANFVELL